MSVPAHLTSANAHACEAWAVDPTASASHALMWAWNGEYQLAIRHVRYSFFAGAHRTASPDVQKRLLGRVWRAIEHDSRERFLSGVIEDFGLLEDAIMKHGKAHPRAPKNTVQQMLKRLEEHQDLAYRMGKCAQRILQYCCTEGPPLSETQLLLIEEDLNERVGIP